MPVKVEVKLKSVVDDSALSISTKAMAPMAAGFGGGMFKAYHTLAKIWTHPGVLLLENSERLQRVNIGYESIDDFVVESSDEGWSDEEKYEKKKKGKKKSKKDDKKKKGKGKGKQDADAEEDDDDNDGNGLWYGNLLDDCSNKGEKMMDMDEEGIEMSSKLVVLMQLLDEAAKENDKVLVFSQSLHVLEVMERALYEMGGGGGKRWKLGRDYFRLDGGTNSKVRQGWIDRFNDRRNTRARLFLLMTKAGGIGVNLVGANRVVLFDAAWNPCMDSQAIYRAYRFGQVCVRVCVWGWVYVCVHVCMRVCLYTCVGLCMCACVEPIVYVHVRYLITTFSGRIRRCSYTASSRRARWSRKSTIGRCSRWRRRSEWSRTSRQSASTRRTTSRSCSRLTRAQTRIWTPWPSPTAQGRGLAQVLAQAM